MASVLFQKMISGLVSGVPGGVSRSTTPPRATFKLREDDNLRAKTFLPNAMTADFLTAGHCLLKIAPVGRPSRQSRATGPQCHSRIS
jgi:hypothetical protein